MKTKVIFLASMVLISLLLTSEENPQKRPMTYEDIIAMKRVGNPVTSLN